MGHPRTSRIAGILKEKPSAMRETTKINFYGTFHKKGGSNLHYNPESFEMVSNGKINDFRSDEGGIHEKIV